MAPETKKKRRIVAPELPPLEFAETPPGWLASPEEQEEIAPDTTLSDFTDDDFEYPDFDAFEDVPEEPEPPKASKFPEIGGGNSALFPEIGVAVHEEIDLQPKETPKRSGREVLFPELNSDPDPLEWLSSTPTADHLPGGPTMTPMVTPGDPGFALFVVNTPADCRGAITLRGAQLSIRVSPDVGLTHQQPLISVIQLPNRTHVQIQSWVESVAPDATVLVGSLDASNFAEIRRLLADPGKVTPGTRPR